MLSRFLAGFSLLLMGLNPLLSQRAADYRATRYDLEVQISLETRRIAGTQRLWLEAQSAINRCVVHLGKDLTVVKARVNGENVAFQRTGDSVLVSLGRTLGRGGAIEVELVYAGPIQAPAEIWADGHLRLSEEWLPARHWFPSLPGPAEAFTLRVILPEERVLLCPGELQSIEPRPGRYTRRSYQVQRSIAPEEMYLLIGPFSRVNDHFSSSAGPVELNWLVPADKEARARTQLQVVRNQLAWLEAELGPYPLPNQPLTWLSTHRDASDLPPARRLAQLARPWLGQDLAPADSLASRILGSLRQYLYYRYLSQMQGEQAARQYLMDGNPAPTGAALWHTLQRTYPLAPGFDTWMRELLQRYGGNPMRGQELIDYFDHYWPGFEAVMVQYLWYRQAPVLVYKVSRERRRARLRCRWEAQAENFALPAWFWVAEQPLELETGMRWVAWEKRGITPRQIEPDLTRGWYRVRREEE